VNVALPYPAARIACSHWKGFWSRAVAVPVEGNAAIGEDEAGDGLGHRVLRPDEVGAAAERGAIAPANDQLEFHSRFAHVLL
jgi:hypothetical protein